MPITDLTVESYSEKAFVIRGETKKYKEQLIDLGGKYNSRLKGGPGYIFPNVDFEKINKFIKEGVNEINSTEDLNKKLDDICKKLDIIIEKLSLKENNECYNSEDDKPLVRIF